MSSPKQKPLKRDEIMVKFAYVVERFDRLSDDALIPLGAVAALEHVSMPTLWRGMKSGIFPKPLALGGLRRVNVGEYRRMRAARQA